MFNDRLKLQRRLDRITLLSSLLLMVCSPLAVVFKHPTDSMRDNIGIAASNEGAIWSLDCTTNALTATYTNTDGSIITPTTVFIDSNGMVRFIHDSILLSICS